MSQVESASYWNKLRGEKVASGIKYPSLSEVLISGLGGLVIIGLLSFINFEIEVFPSFIVPFGASAVLVFAAPAAPFSQPRNVMGGHLISGLSGLIVMAIFQEQSWLALGLANGLAIAAMVATKTVHPPAGATSLLPITGNITSFGWLFTPVFIGVLIILIIGIVYNNIWARRKYPSYWY